MILTSQGCYEIQLRLFSFKHSLITIKTLLSIVISIQKGNREAFFFLNGKSNER